VSEDIEKEVRDWLRMSDLLIARIQTAKPLSQKEVAFIQSYNERIRSVLLSLKGFEIIRELSSTRHQGPDGA
jgi:hypothetical protein